MGGRRYVKSQVPSMVIVASVVTLPGTFRSTNTGLSELSERFPFSEHLVSFPDYRAAPEEGDGAFAPLRVSTHMGAIGVSTY